MIVVKILRLLKALWRHWASLGLSDFSITGNVAFGPPRKKKNHVWATARVNETWNSSYSP